jgi:hypothetical protein
MTTLNVPIVENENYISKNCRMLFVVGGLVLGIIILMNIQTQRQHEMYSPGYNRHTQQQLENMSSGNMDTIPSGEPVAAKTITLYNLNKKIIPVDAIAVIGTDTRMWHIHRTDAKTNILNGMGSSMRFELPSEIYIKHIVIDVDQFSKSRKNITTTQIDVRNTKDDVVWSNYKQLHSGKRYVDVYIVEPNIIHPVKSQKLCTGLPESYQGIQENRLNDVLYENVWI